MILCDSNVWLALALSRQFFRLDPIDVNRLCGILRFAGDFETLQEDGRSLTVIVSRIKVSFV